MQSRTELLHRLKSTIRYLRSPEGSSALQAEIRKDLVGELAGKYITEILGKDTVSFIREETRRRYNLLLSELEEKRKKLERR